MSRHVLEHHRNHGCDTEWKDSLQPQRQTTKRTQENNLQRDVYTQTRHKMQKMRPMKEWMKEFIWQTKPTNRKIQQDKMQCASYTKTTQIMQKMPHKASRKMQRAVYTTTRKKMQRCMNDISQGVLMLSYCKRSCRNKEVQTRKRCSDVRDEETTKVTSSCTRKLGSMRTPSLNMLMSVGNPAQSHVTQIVC